MWSQSSEGRPRLWRATEFDRGLNCLCLCIFVFLFFLHRLSNLWQFSPESGWHSLALSPEVPLDLSFFFFGFASLSTTRAQASSWPALKISQDEAAIGTACCFTGSAALQDNLGIVQPFL